MKKFILGLVLGVVISASGSVAMAITKPAPVPKAVVNTQNMSVLGAKIGAIAPQIEFDSFTGKRLSKEEKRMRTLEARVSALEAKLK